MSVMIKSRRAWATFSAGVLWFAIGSVWAVPELPAALTSPDQRVVCNPERGICYDRLGPSTGLTQVFLGREAAESLTAVLRDTLPPSGVGAFFFAGTKYRMRARDWPVSGTGRGA